MHAAWGVGVGVSMALLLGLGLAQVLSRSERPTAGDVTLFLAAVVAMQQAVLALTDQVSMAGEGLLALRQSRQIVASPRASKPISPDVTAGANGDGLRLENIVLRYPGSSRAALDGVSVHFFAGSMTAVVGANGSGKTSLLKVAAGLYAPESGTVSIAGMPINDEANDRFTAVFQEPTRYDLSVAENIAISDHGRKHDYVPAARTARLHGRIAALPQGYETVLSRSVELSGQVGESTYFSGGEWQRLATARALHRDRAGIFLLDEPAAHLDAAATSDTLDVIDAWMSPSRCVVMVTHRLDHARRMDRIVVMEHGRIVEDGNHEDLMDREGTYSRMWEAYAGL